MSAAALIWSPFEDEGSAKEAIATLLNERLVACGNIVPGVQSLFAWEGERGEGVECGVLFKTSAARLSEAMARLEELHPYDQPAIFGWQAAAPSSTIAWLEAQTSPGGDTQGA